ncbi:MAG: hypothetical protein AAFY72_13440 [Cyanobacteria bacterium J06649_4]
MLAGAAAILTLSVGCVNSSDYRVFTPTTPPGIPLPPEPVRDRTLATAAADLNIPQSELGTLRITEETWPDGCLGIGLANEVCLQALVEGWQIEVVHEGQNWFYRTDATGETVRQSFLENNLPPSLSELVLTAAQREIQRDPQRGGRTATEQLQIVRAEPRTWNDCLGLEEPNVICQRVPIYGWRVSVIGDNQLLIYHTDMIGKQIKRNLRYASVPSDLAPHQAWPQPSSLTP